MGYIYRLGNQVRPKGAKHLMNSGCGSIWDRPVEGTITALKAEVIEMRLEDGREGVVCYGGLELIEEARHGQGS